VTYKSTAESKVFNWVDKEKTNGKQKGMMFTQCQPIACRGLAPMQDTPVYKTTYNAHVAVDQGYVVKMSAIGDDHGMGQDGNGRPVFAFAQNMQVTTYMIAIVVGELETKKVGDRVNVITEPGMMNEVSN
jgi:leukotriene-A4 hydrolase